MAINLKIKRILKISSMLIGLGFFSGVLLLLYFKFTLPSIDGLANYEPPVPSLILSKDGEVLLEAGKENRDISDISDIPPIIIDSFLAAEDDRFYEHSGVDYAGLARAMWKNVLAGRVVQGGSTITQQVAKKLLLSSERKYSRKIRDFLLAQEIEKKYSKDQILFLYLNEVYLGGGYYGVKAAFNGYFDKELSEASVPESSLVAGLLVAPTKYSPYVNPIYAKERQKYVLRRLFDTGKITQEQYEEAQATEIKLRIRKPQPMKAGYFTDWIRQRIVREVGNEKFLTEGYKVHTTLNYSLQKRAEEAISYGLKEIDKRQGYKGPLGHAADDQAIIDFIKKSRIETLKSNSNYFTLKTDGSVIYELKELEEFEEDYFSKIINDLYQPTIKDDPLDGLIKKDEIYEAVVIKVERRKRLVYISVAGKKGYIPYDGYKWAHQRYIEEEKNLFPYVTDPNEILKRGDIIQVKIIKNTGNLKKDTYSDYKYKKDEEEKLKDVSYFSASLDQDPEVQGALVAMHPTSGEIISFVGGSDFSKSQFNRAIQSLRQPGSSFKPFIYASALENGFTPASILIDAPEALYGVDADLKWKPRNYDRKFMGPITLRKALEKSRNVPTIKLTSHIGVETLFSFLDRLKFKAEVPKDLSISLGSFGISLLNLTQAYAIFPNGGKYIEPQSIITVQDRNGNFLDINLFKDDANKEEAIEGAVNQEESSFEMSEAITQDEPILTQDINEKEDINPFLENLDGTQVYDSRLAYVMTNLLKGIIQNGTGRSARNISQFIGGKTGTTNSYIDALFMGFSHNTVLGVWTGFDDNKSLGWAESGAKAALPIWKMYMRDALKQLGEEDFATPNGIVNALIDRDTGKAITGAKSNAFMEAFAQGTEPGGELLKKEASAEDVPQDILEDEEFYNR